MSTPDDYGQMLTRGSICSVMNRPILLIDVDGVISLFGFDHGARPDGRFLLVDGITHFLSGTAGGHLRRLEPAFELAWCTGWEGADAQIPSVAIRANAMSGKWRAHPAASAANCVRSRSSR